MVRRKSMPLAFTPTAALAKLYKFDPTTARYLTAGMAVFAVAAIVSVWSIDIVTMGLVGLYVLTLGLVAIAVANLPSLPRTILGSFLVGFLMVALTTIFISAVTEPAWPKPAYCLVKVWDRCRDEEEAYAARNAKSIDAKVKVPEVIATPAASLPPKQSPGAKVVSVPTVPPRRVFIQFAGRITRDSMRDLNSALARGGWHMQGESGERTEKATGKNELRYGLQEDRLAAGWLADAVTATGVTSSPVVPRYNSSVGSDFELWISK
jgi:hypothetical protein